MPTPFQPRAARSVAILISLASALLLVGCASTKKPELDAPNLVISPYNTEQGQVLLVVPPLRNESGTTVVDAQLMTDKLIAATAEIRGVRTVPLNRVLQAMLALEMRGVASPSDARKLAEALGADGVIVGSITAFDPYTPSIGLTAGLFARPGSMTPRKSQGLDARSLTTSVNDLSPAGSRFDSAPLSLVSGHFDGKNHQVQHDLRSYAMGRTERISALGWRRYLASSELFAEFACHQTMADLMRAEWLRLGAQTPEQVSASSAGKEDR